MSINICVVVPTYNRADLIPLSLKTILSQSYQPDEIIVVDDGSKDNTEEVVRRFGSSVRYLRIENSGECRARNVGVSHSQCEYVAFCDSDDLWHPDKLMSQVRIFEATPECDYSFTNFRTVVDDIWSQNTKFDTLPPDFFDLQRCEIDKDLFVIQVPMFRPLLLNQPIFPSTIMMKRSFFENVGRWDEPLGRTPSVDLEFHLRCVGRPNIGVVAAPMVGIRKHASNFSGNPLKLALGEVAVLRYVLANNPQARQYVRTIEDQISLRSGWAAGLAFAAGDLELSRKLMGHVLRKHRSWKIKVKNMILRCPNWIGRNLLKTPGLLGRKLRPQHSR
jgi:glycosyl transferase family 2